MTTQANAGAAGLLVTCALTLLCLAWWTWPLGARLSTHTAIATVFSPDAPGQTEPGMAAVGANDQVLSIWNTSHNARALSRADLPGLLQPGQCAPMPWSGTLNEHMIDHGMLSLPWWLATGDPVASFHGATAASIVIGAAGMFLFLFQAGGSAAAAVAGALVFALAPGRAPELLVHPAVGGVHWIPWVLWSLERMLAGGGLAAHVAFAVTLIPAALVGSYPLLALGGVLAPYTLARVLLGGQPGLRGFHSGDSFWRSAGRIAVGAAPALVVLGIVLALYSRVHSQWHVTRPAAPILVDSMAAYLPGHELFAGMVAAAGLIPLALVRGARSPVPVALAISAVLLASFCTRLGSFTPYEAVAAFVPVLSSVRVPARAAYGVMLCLQALGALGWARLLNWLPTSAAIAAGGLLVLVAASELLHDGLSRALYGRVSSVTLHEAAPSPGLRETLMRTLQGDRAVLDLPEGRMAQSPRALMLAAYHGLPTSACYTSLVPPTQRAVSAMAKQIAAAPAIEELSAAGFGYIVRRNAGRNLAAGPVAPNARMVASRPDVEVWELPPPPATHADASLLRIELTGGGTRKPYLEVEPPYEIDLTVTNQASAMWAAPPQPLVARVELRSADGGVAFDGLARGAMPPALAAGNSATTTLTMTAGPPPGTYIATVEVVSLGMTLRSESFVWEK